MEKIILNLTFILLSCFVGSIFSEPVAQLVQKSQQIDTVADEDNDADENPWKHGLCKNQNGGIQFWAKSGFISCSTCPITELTPVAKSNPICFVCCHGKKKEPTVQPTQANNDNQDENNNNKGYLSAVIVLSVVDLLALLAFVGFYVKFYKPLTLLQPIPDTRSSMDGLNIISSTNTAIELEQSQNEPDSGHGTPSKNNDNVLHSDSYMVELSDEDSTTEESNL